MNSSQDVLLHKRTASLRELSPVALTDAWILPFRVSQFFTKASPATYVTSFEGPPKLINLPIDLGILRLDAGAQEIGAKEVAVGSTVPRGIIATGGDTVIDIHSGSSFDCMN